MALPPAPTWLSLRAEIQGVLLDPATRQPIGERRLPVGTSIQDAVATLAGALQTKQDPVVVRLKGLDGALAIALVSVMDLRASIERARDDR
jgi:hypothetical protein